VPTWTRAGCVRSSGSAFGNTTTGQISNSSEAVFALPVALGGHDAPYLVLGVETERQDRARAAAVAGGAEDPVQDVGVGAPVQVHDGERREPAPRRHRAEWVEHAPDLSVLVRVDLRAQERVDRVEHEQRDLVLDDELLE
jgi:hypothetical protein